jgi:NAD(P)-dependent dehydrogenase (short-subunit alcohol dehydrogenase family)
MRERVENGPRGTREVPVNVRRAGRAVIIHNEASNVSVVSMTDSGQPNTTAGKHEPVRRGDLEPLAGTRVLVSGATSGLGHAMASALVKAGAEVIIAGRQLARAQASAAGLGPRAVGLALDVRDEASVRAAVEQGWERLGRVDVLVNNAGIGMRNVNPRFLTDPQPFWEVSPEGFRAVLDAKATGSFLLARELVPRMLGAGGGRVVNISMNEQTMTRRGFVPYGPSGAAVEALSRVMAADLADTSVRVNVLLPGGATATGMVSEDAPAEVRASLLDPAVMGPPIVWLASPDAEDVHDERIVASDFDSWLASRTP